MSPGRLQLLPPELLDAILAALPARDILRARLACRLLNACFCASPRIQYMVACAASGVIDDDIHPDLPCEDRSAPPGIPFAERLDMLHKREEAWRALTPQKRWSFKVPFSPSSLYDFTGGATVLGQRKDPGSRRSTQGLASVVMHEAESAGVGGEVEWNTVRLEDDVVDFGLAVQEHDLNAALTIRWDDRNADYASYDLHLLEFSTGAPHTRAKKPDLHICSAAKLFGRASVLIEIVGDLLVLLLCFPHAIGRDLDALYVVEWKEGLVHKVATCDSSTYSSLAFITPDTLLLPNTHTASLDLVRILRDPLTGVLFVRTACSLRLPPLQPLATARVTACRAEPNVMPSGLARRFARPSRPFRDDPARALVLMHVELSRALRGASYALIVPRSALLAYARAADADAWHALSYAAWARDACWVPEDGSSWITRAAGMRHVFLSDQRRVKRDGVERRIATMRVCDFNPVAVRREKLRAAAAATGDPATHTADSNGRVTRVVGGMRAVGAREFFEHGVECGLEYVETTRAEQVEYAAAWMDEERIVGIKTAASGSGIAGAEVLVFG